MFICDMVLPWLLFTIKGQEQDWLAQCQFKMTGWGIMFICGMVLVYWQLKTRLESGPVTAELTTTVVHRYESLRNDIKRVHSF